MSTCANAKIWAEAFCSRDGLVYSFWLGIAASIVCNVSQRQFPRQIHLIPVLFEKAAGRTNPQGTFRWSTSSLCQFVSWVCLPHVLFFWYVSQSSNQDPVFQKFTQSKCGHFVLAAAFRSECVLAGDGPNCEDSGWCHFSETKTLVIWCTQGVTWPSLYKPNIRIPIEPIRTTECHKDFGTVLISQIHVHTHYGRKLI